MTQKRLSFSKNALLGTDRNLRLANDKAHHLPLYYALGYKSHPSALYYALGCKPPSPPTMKAKFDELNDNP
jgi:hypothetical protein